jgi:hypothetical protein
MDGRKETTRKTKMYGGWIIFRWILERQDGVVYTKLVWLRIKSSGGLL